MKPGFLLCWGLVAVLLGSLGLISWPFICQGWPVMQDLHSESLAPAFAGARPVPAGRPGPTGPQTSLGFLSSPAMNDS